MPSLGLEKRMVVFSAKNLLRLLMSLTLVRLSAFPNFIASAVRHRAMINVFSPADEITIKSKCDDFAKTV